MDQFKRRRSIRPKKIIFIITTLAVFVLGFYTYRAWRFLKAIGVSGMSNLTQPKTTYTTAILGYSGGFHEGTYLTDTIIISHINYKTEQALLISVPRDVWVKLPTKSNNFFAAKVNSIYQLHLFPKTYPDVNIAKFKNTDFGLLKEVLRQITGLEIDTYLAIDFNAFTKTIDKLGGIDLIVDKSFTDKEYPIEGKESDLCGKEEGDLEELEKIATESPELAFPCRYETVTFLSGEVHLTGLEALKYARSRRAPEDRGDFARANRQQKVIEAVTNKLISPLFIPKIPALMSELESEIKTDAKYDQIQKVIKEIPKAKEYQITKLILSTDNYLKNKVSQDGQYILVPKSGPFKWNKINKDINKISQGISLTPTSKVLPTKH